MLTPSLSQFQDAFADAVIRGSDAPTQDAALVDLFSQPGFMVYRNTVMKGCIDALQANYPSVLRLVGEEWFRAAAAVFVRGHLPRRPSLAVYGEEFPNFLASFEPAAALPYLSDVALLDRFWTEAHVATDDPRLEAAMVAALSNTEVARAVLHPHASARWAWFGQAPIFSIWRCNRDEAMTNELRHIAWHSEGALLVRPEGMVDAVPLGAAECAFLNACSSGRSLADAGLEALTVAPDTDLADLLQRLLRAGAFTRIDICEQKDKEYS